MSPNPFAPRSLTLALAATAVLGFTACGEETKDEVRKQTTEVREQSQSAQDKVDSTIDEVQKTADKVRSGELDPDDAQRTLEKMTDSLRDDARKAADDAIERAKKSGVPKEALQQLEDARKQLDAQR